MKRNKTTIHDIAKVAGVSLMTVSRAIRGQPGVGEEMKNKIINLALNMGYIPNRSLQELGRQRSSMTVGVVIPHLGNTIFSQILQNIEIVLSLYGYRILLCCNYDNPIKEFHDISALLEREVNGIIWAPLHLNASVQAAEIIKKQNCPLVFVDRKIPDWKADSVLVDDFHGALSITRHLLKQGLTQIAYIGPDQLSYVGKERKRGFLEGMKEHSLSVREDWIIDIGSDIPSGQEGAARLLALKDRPKAIFCFNDPLAIGVEMELLEHQIAIPSAIALTGFSNTIETTIARIPITSVSQDAIGLGQTAAELLLKRMINPQIKLAPEERILKTHLILRESSLLAK